MTHYPFKASPIESFDQPFEPLPEGSYKCEIVKIELMRTKDQHGQYIFICFKIKEGDFKGRTIFQRFNIDNRSAKAENIAKKHLSMLCYSIGIDSWENIEELLNYETIINMREGNNLYGFSKINPESSIPEIPEYSPREEPPIIPPNDFVDDKIPF